jgi:uncharacterized surface protein with fasciclin (FAS1) repeats
MRPRPRRRPGPAGPRHQELVGPFTVFAPANEVFGEGGGLLVPKNIKELAAVLTYYVVSGNILRHRGGGSGGGGARRAAAAAAARGGRQRAAAARGQLVARWPAVRR